MTFLNRRRFAGWIKGVRTVHVTQDGVLWEIAHELRIRMPVLAPLAEPIIGGFFIHHVANQTLREMKRHLEARA